MCLPTKTDQPSHRPRPARARSSGTGGLMLLACLGGPVLAGAFGGLGAGVLLGAGGVVFALALCAAVPAIVLALRRRAARRQPTPELLSRPSCRSNPKRAWPAATTADPKSVVRRLIEEVMNGGRLDVIDELYTPEMAAGRGAGSRRSAKASPTSRWRSSS